MSLAASKDPSTKRARDTTNAPPKADEASRQQTPKRPVHYNVIVRLPFPRGDFVDPAPVNWDATKDRKLWKLISRNGGKSGATRGSHGGSASASEGGDAAASGAGNAEVDWDAKAAEFGVDTRFLLQQAAWLYERHLEHVKKQVGRLRTGSAAGTPQPGQTSQLGKKPLPSSRAPSALSVRSRDSPLPRVDTNIANTSHLRPSGLSRTPSNATVTQSRQYGVPPSPKSRTLRTSSIRKQPSSDLPSPVPDEESPGPASSSSEESSDDEAVKASRHTTAFRRAPRFGAKQSMAKNLAAEDDDKDDQDEDSEEGEPTFYSTAQLDGPHASTRKQGDRPLDSTLRTNQPSRGKQPLRDRPAANVEPKSPQKKVSNTQLGAQKSQRTVSGPTSAARAAPSATTESSGSSLSSTNAPTNAPPRTNISARRPTHPLSPRHRADLARLSSPRRGDTSDGTPSMGSSFSDLDVDASVTQSALEEALASNLRNGGSRLSNISNAFRSRYM